MERQEEGLKKHKIDLEEKTRLSRMLPIRAVLEKGFIEQQKIAYEERVALMTSRALEDYRWRKLAKARYMLEEDNEHRQQEEDQALTLLLALLRESGSPNMVVAKGGHFQQALQAGRSYSLMRVRIGTDSQLIPEMSGHRLMASVRLMRPDGEGRLRPSADDASFELTLCS